MRHIIATAVRPNSIATTGIIAGVTPVSDAMGPVCSAMTCHSYSYPDGCWRWLIIFFLLPAAAFGHARFESSEPADGAVLAEAPARFLLEFSESVQPAALELLDDAGDALPLELPAGMSGPVLEFRPKLPLAAGNYRLGFRVISADAHAVSGSVAFAVLPGQPVVQPEPVPAEVAAPVVIHQALDSGPLPSWPLLVSRGLFILLLLLAAGLAMFRILMPLPEGLVAWLHHRIAVVSGAGLLAGALYLQGAGSAMLGWAWGFDPAALQLALASTLGLSMLVAMAGFMLLLAGAWSGLRALLLAGLLLLLASRMLTGHPAAREPGWLLAPAMFLHVACAAWWYGSLWPLARSLATLPAQQAAMLLHRFSALAMAAVAVLAWAGLLMALVHLAAPQALISTAYGQLLSVKSIVFLLVLALAGWHKLVLSRRVGDGVPGAAFRLRRSISLEALLITSLLLLATVLAATAPEAPALLKR